MPKYTLQTLLESGNYSPDLINSLKSKNFSALRQLTSEQISDADYMYTLLWAVKNELGTFAVYPYMSEELQKDTTITLEVLKSEPALFAESPQSKDRDFIKANIKSIPQIAFHMSPQLKADSQFVQELCEMSSPEVAKQIMEDTNYRGEMSPSIGVSSDMVNDAIIASIVADASNMSLLTEEQKNDSELLKDIITNNEGALDYVIDNIGTFGNDGLKGASEANEQIIIDTFIGNMTETAKDSPILNIESIIEKMPEMDPQRGAAMSGAAYVLSGQLDPESAKQIINDLTLNMQRAKNDPAWLEDPDAYSYFPDNLILEDAMRVCRENGIEIPETSIQLLEGYKEFQQDLMSKHKEKEEEKLSEGASEVPDEWTYEEKQNERLAKEAQEAGVEDIDQYICEHWVDYEDFLKARGVEPNEKEEIEPSDIKEAASEVRSEELNAVTTHVKEEIAIDNTQEIEQGENR